MTRWQRLLMVVMVFGLAAAAPASAWAHDMYVGNVTPELFGDPGVGSMQTYTHEDKDPFKGWAFFTVQNNGTESWTDFHFEIISVTVGGTFYDATSVTIYDVTSIHPPVTSQNPVSIVVSNPPGGLSSLDYYFPNDPVPVSDIATFSFYTDNTANNVAYFGLAAWPTPEPASLVLMSLGVGGILLVRRRRAA
jgi:hypothetical protein